MYSSLALAQNSTRIQKMKTRNLAREDSVVVDIENSEKHSGGKETSIQEDIIEDL
ncbi:hypothetical protein A2U01_0058562, partial [Trifolium medium]|nr:hypothetical protein [Trifolium medium]